MTTDPAELAYKIINNTNKNLFLTGKAGTGKTTFLKHIVSSTHKKCIVTAPTGIAAINANGVTLHSLFQLPFGSFVPEVYNGAHASSYLKINDPYSLIKALQLNATKRSLLRELELLIIDEVSMLRSDLLDAIDVILKSVRRNQHKPFGGVQLLFIGDLLQLPPVVKDEEWQILRAYYNSVYFFDSKVLQNEKPIYVELEKIYRQDDEIFIGLLNHLRTNSVTPEDLKLLNSYYKPNTENVIKNCITLTTHNAKADRINKDYLQSISSPSLVYKAKIKDDFNENAYPIEFNLELKVGAQVMFVKNDASGAQRFFNGKIGTISELKSNEIWVQFSDTTKPINVETYEWKNIKYIINATSNEIEEQVVGTFVQFPLKLAWAITVHKSQGLTFDKAIIDIGEVFAPGQAYVALSRLRSLNGLILNTPINEKGIELNMHVAAFSNTKTETNTLIEQVKNEQSNYLLDVLVLCFDFTETLRLFQEHLITYQIEKKKSVKIQHLKWMKDVVINLEALKVNADKFQNQIRYMLSPNMRNYELLVERLEAALGYFLPQLNESSDLILNKIKEINTQKRIKTFVTELLFLENLIFSKTIDLHKSILLTNAFIHQTTFSKDDLNSLVINSKRNAKLKDCLEQNETLLTIEKKSSKKKTRASEDDEFEEDDKKAESKEQTYNLFVEGLSVEEIAQTRRMALSTIEGHLVQYVASGILSNRKFVSSKKEKEIISVAKQLNSFKLAEIKDELSSDYSYSEIKFAIAGYLAG